jgi:hypothetical protein
LKIIRCQGSLQFGECDEHQPVPPFIVSMPMIPFSRSVVAEFSAYLAGSPALLGPPRLARWRHETRPCGQQQTAALPERVRVRWLSWAVLFRSDVGAEAPRLRADLTGLAGATRCCLQYTSPALKQQ